MNERLAGLDGLRGVAAYLVVVSHISNTTGLWGRLFGDGLGQIGVMIFFSLSGFLMARLYLDKPLSAQTLADFIRRRVARVIPLYLLIVLLAFAVTITLPERFWFYNINPENLWEHLIFWKGVSVLWTIPAEVQFYLAFPLIWLAYARWGSSSSFLLASAAVAIAFLGFRSIGVLPVVLSVGHYFVVGVLAALIYKTVAPSQAVAPANIGFLITGAAVILFSPNVYASIWGARPERLWANPGLLVAVPTLIMCSISSSLASVVLGNRVMRLLGDISYSVYLLHIPVLIYIGRFTSLAKEPLAYAVAILVVTTGLSYLSFRFIERPTRAVISSFRLPARSVSPAE